MYEWRSHTAEVELAIIADTEEAVFADAVSAFADLVAVAGGGAAERREVSLQARDLASLLVEWLDELVFLADTEGFVAARMDGVRLDGPSISATLVGRRGRIDPLVKAATYHGLEFARGDGVWHARVVLDV